MQFKSLALLAAAAAAAEATTCGFNYGATFTTGAAKQQSDFEAEFNRAQSLQSADCFNSARLYTMIQAGTTNTPISAIPAAIATKTTLLLGLWASAGQDDFNNELQALQSAIEQYGSSFIDLVVGISVGNEDLYRITPTGIKNQAGIGASPDTIVSYIKQLRSAISGTAASGFSVGHVDTWTAWVNSSNDAVIDSVDWIGVDAYPYFETVLPDNSINTGKDTFYSALDQTIAVASGKPVWITETGWPVSGPVSGKAVASIANAKTYWDEVACTLLGKYNTWWYTLQDAEPGTPSPSFGIIGTDLSSAPLYDLTCPAGSSGAATCSKQNSTSSSSSSSATGKPTTSGSAKATGSTGSTATTLVATGSVGTGSYPVSGTGAVPYPTGSGAAGASGIAPAGAGSATSSLPGAAFTGAANKAIAGAGAGLLAVFGIAAAL